MAAANYAELVDEVKAWLNRDDPDTINRIPTFINFAEKEIYRVLKLPVYESVVQLTIKNGRAEVPFNLVQLIEIYTNDNRVGRHTSHRELIRHRAEDVTHDQSTTLALVTNITSSRTWIVLPVMVVRLKCMHTISVTQKN